MPPLATEGLGWRNELDLLLFFFTYLLRLCVFSLSSFVSLSVGNEAGPCVKLFPPRGQLEELCLRTVNSLGAPPVGPGLILPEAGGLGVVCQMW